jgi:hypothetical protein
MNPKISLDIAKSKSSYMVTILFPKECDLFEDIWSLLLPTFQKWLGLKASARHFRVGRLPPVGGLTFDKEAN